MTRIFGRILHRKRKTDDEFVKGIRRIVSMQDRWGKYFLAWHAINVVAWSGIMAFIAIFGAKLGNMNANVVVFFIGAMLGFVVGSHLAFSLIQLVTHSSILHSQRLLLGYHDALATLVEHQVDVSQAVDVA